MHTETLSSERTQQLLASLTLPPLPTTLAELKAALARDEDLLTLTSVVSHDLAVAAAVIKIANSPTFATRKLDSIHDAVMVLGASNLESVVTGISLRHALPVPPILHSFWDEAMRAAAIAAEITRRWHLGRPEQAYLFSLFRDAGIPVLIQRFDFYLAVLSKAMADPANFVACEIEHRATSHTVVGCLLARTWGMPETFSQAILLHHELADLADESRMSRESARLIAVARLAEYLLTTHVMGEKDRHWPLIAAFVLSELGISKEDVEDLAGTLH